MCASVYVCVSACACVHVCVCACMPVPVCACQCVCLCGWCPRNTILYIASEILHTHFVHNIRHSVFTLLGEMLHHRNDSSDYHHQVHDKDWSLLDRLAIVFHKSPEGLQHLIGVHKVNRVALHRVGVTFLACQNSDLLVQIITLNRQARHEAVADKVPFRLLSLLKSVIVNHAQCECCDLNG